MKKNAKTTGKKRTKSIAKKASAAKTKSARSKPAISRKTTGPRKKTHRKKRQMVGLEALEPKRPRGRSGRQTGDVQGLSRVEGADSESVAELVEEGNTFEAGIVSGVEAADLDVGEVQTHEVPEDDVPDEYHDK
jgi:hypothetical protein